MKEVRELTGWEKHWEQGRANEADAGQVRGESVEGKDRLGRSTGTQEEKCNR